MKLIKLLRDVIIAPHGVTDISHSIQTNNQLNLLKINTFMIGGTNFIINNYNYDDILNLLFFASTIIHFRHDMPKININNYFIPRYLLCSLMILFFSVIGFDYLIYYMILFHVPNHYKFNKDVLINDFNKNIMLITIVSLISLYFDYYLSINFDSNISNLVKAIIISHVIYQEKYVMNNE
tara:strand:- start:120 stop:659 length:540 start_codon:yes stop_codon:yes gene_type:complete